MLLVFFLVTSSMDSDKGLRRQLPPPPEEQQQAVDIRQDDILTVKLDDHGRVWVDDKTISLAQAQQRIVEFAAVAPKRRVISLDVSPDATYDSYFHLQETILQAYRRLKATPRISESVEDGKEVAQ